MIRRILADGTLEAIGSESDNGSATPVLVVRSIGATRPTTVGWAVNDAWLDTSSGTANVIRLWTGSAFSPAESGAPALGTLLMSDDFSGTDDAGWNAAKWARATTPSAGTGGASTLLSGTGRLQSSNPGGYSGGSLISEKTLFTAAADTNTEVSFKFDGTEAFFSVFARSAAAVNKVSAYAMSFSPADGWSVDKFNSSGTPTNLGGAQTFSFTAGTWYRARFRVVGTTVQARMWTVGATEPGTWPVSVTDSTITAAGVNGISVSGGNAASSSRVFFDDLVIRAS